MTAALALLAAVALGATPPDRAGTASPAAVAAAPGPAREVRVERRLLVKRDRWFLTAGPAWLARGDYYTSPGLGLAVAFYPYERGGLELRVAAFSSRLDAAAREVRDATGLVPDAHRPRALASAGWRHGVAYGKVATGSPGILHFDAQVSGAAGLLVTDRATTPCLSAGPGVLLRLGDRMVGQLDVLATGSFERRAHAAFSPGLLVSLGVGAWL